MTAFVSNFFFLNLSEFVVMKSTYFEENGHFVKNKMLYSVLQIRRCNSDNLGIISHKNIYPTKKEMHTVGFSIFRS